MAITNPTGKGGFNDHPENKGLGGRPPRKTIVEMVEDYLKAHPDEMGDLPTIISTMMMKKKDKEMIKEYWHQRDGMPKQATEIDLHSDIAIVLQTKK